MHADDFLTQDESSRNYSTSDWKQISASWKITMYMTFPGTLQPVDQDTRTRQIREDDIPAQEGKEPVALLESIEILDDAEQMASFRRGAQDIAAGRMKSWEDAKRELGL